MKKHTTPPAVRSGRLQPVVGNRNAHAKRRICSRWRTPGRYARFLNRTGALGAPITREVSARVLAPIHVMHSLGRANLREPVDYVDHPDPDDNCTGSYP